MIFVEFNSFSCSEESQIATTGSAKEKAVQFYTSCMNTDQIEAQGAEPLKKVINEVITVH